MLVFEMSLFVIHIYIAQKYKHSLKTLKLFNFLCQNINLNYISPLSYHNLFNIKNRNVYFWLGLFYD